MSITIRWWIVVALLVVAPLVYSYFREPTEWWDTQIDTMFVAAVCWALAIGLTIGKLL